MPHSNATPRDTAIVVGGSMAGLLSARVLADHFDHVTVVDRDRFPAEPVFRKGVPQSRHLHVLLTRGLEIIERLFPGIAEDLADQGAIRLKWPTDGAWLSPQGWAQRFGPGLDFISCSRELLEWTIRRHLTARDNVHFIQGYEVTALLATPGAHIIEGVRLKPRPSATDDTEGVVEELRASIIVDASGRHSKAPAWLAAIGSEAPEEEKVDAFLGYATRDYAIPHDFIGDWKAVILQAKPPETARTGYLFQIAPARWRLSANGAGRDYPPTDEEGFLAFVKSLRSPLIYEAISSAEPVGAIHGYQETRNQWRHYESLHRMPERFIVTGDAFTALNPIYGQGMTAAAQSALVLDRLLREQSHNKVDLGPRFHRASARANVGAWMMATYEDLRYHTTEGGRRDLSVRIIHRYLDRVIRAALDIRRVHSAYIDVIQLVNPPTSLFKPMVLAPALLRGGRTERTAAPAIMLRKTDAGAGEARRPSVTRQNREKDVLTERRPPLRTRVIRVAEVRTPVIEAGFQDSDEAVVFVHGNPGSSLDWTDLLQEVGTFARALAFDMPGFGRADRPADFDYTVEGYARHLAGALDLLGVRRAHLVLHDFGGAWGLEWAIANPHAFASVVLINSLGIPTHYRWHALARIWQTPLLGEAFMAMAIRPATRVLRAWGNPRGLSRTFVNRMYEDFDHGTRSAVLRLYRASRDIGGIGRRQAEALRETCRPALIIWGKHDPYLPVSLAKRQRDALLDARMVILEDSGHWPFADNAERVAQEIVPFLRRVTANTAPAEIAQSRQSTPR